MHQEEENHQIQLPETIKTLSPEINNNLRSNIQPVWTTFPLKHTLTCLIFEIMN